MYAMNIKRKVLDKVISDTKSIYEMESYIDELSTQISKTWKTKKGRVIVIGSGVFLNILRLELEELEDFFGLGSDRFEIIVSGQKLEETVENWKSMGDMAQAAVVELSSVEPTEEDTVLIISNTARGDYIKNAISYASDLGVKTGIITNADDEDIHEKIDFVVKTDFSNRETIGLNLYSVATMQKIVTDMVIFDALEKIGRVWKGYLVFIKPFTYSVRKDCIKILSELCELSFEEAGTLLEESEDRLELSIIRHKLGLNLDEAKRVLVENDFNFNKIFNENMQ